MGDSLALVEAQDTRSTGFDRFVREGATPGNTVTMRSQATPSTVQGSHLPSQLRIDLLAIDTTYGPDGSGRSVDLPRPFGHDWPNRAKVEMHIDHICLYLSTEEELK